MMVIYQITNTVTGRFYVGSAKDLDRRISAHRSQLKYLIGRAINKHGWDAFKVDVLEHVDCETMLLEREQHWLDTLQPFPPSGYNMCRTAGSTLGKEWSDTHRENMMTSIEGHGDWGGWNRGCVPWNKDQVWSEEQKDYLSKQRLGKLKGATNHKSLSCFFINPQGVEVYTESISMLCKEHDLHVGAMCDVRKGRRNQHKGWSFSRDTKP